MVMKRDHKLSVGGITLSLTAHCKYFGSIITNQAESINDIKKKIMLTIISKYENL